MDPRLAEAARSGNTDTLYALLRGDPYLLENIEALVPFINTPLHEVVISKQTGFAIEMMNLNPSFARKLNPDGFTLMHLTVAIQESWPKTDGLSDGCSCRRKFRRVTDAIPIIFRANNTRQKFSTGLLSVRNF